MLKKPVFQVKKFFYLYPPPPPKVSKLTPPQSTLKIYPPSGNRDPGGLCCRAYINYSSDRLIWNQICVQEIHLTVNGKIIMKTFFK